MYGGRPCRIDGSAAKTCQTEDRQALLVGLDLVLRVDAFVLEFEEIVQFVNKLIEDFRVLFGLNPLCKVHPSSRVRRESSFGLQGITKQVMQNL